MTLGRRIKATHEGIKMQTFPDLQFESTYEIRKRDLPEGDLGPDKLLDFINRDLNRLILTIQKGESAPDGELIEIDSEWMRVAEGRSTFKRDYLHALPPLRERGKDIFVTGGTVTVNENKTVAKITLQGRKI